MTKSSQKRVKIIYHIWNLHTLKCKEKHLRARAARAFLAPVGQGGLRPRARAGRVSMAPGGLGGSQQRARAARLPPAPGYLFFEFTYPEKQREHIPRVNKYQS